LFNYFSHDVIKGFLYIFSFLSFAGLNYLLYNYSLLAFCFSMLIFNQTSLFFIKKKYTLSVFEFFFFSVLSPFYIIHYLGKYIVTTTTTKTINKEEYIVKMYLDNVIKYYKNNKLHNDTNPAIIYPLNMIDKDTGKYISNEFWYEGKKIKTDSKKSFQKVIQKLKFQKKVNKF
jgi:hypothetical protein